MIAEQFYGNKLEWYKEDDWRLENYSSRDGQACDSCQDSCQWPDISHVFERNSPRLSPGLVTVTIRRLRFPVSRPTRLSRRGSPVISDTSREIWTPGRETAEQREREYSQGEEKRAVSLRYCLVRTGAREAPGAVTRDVNSTCPGNSEYICHVPWEPSSSTSI